PGHAEFWTDVRVIPGMDESTFRDDVTSALARAAGDILGATYDIDYHPTLGWVTPTEVKPGDPVVTASCRAAESVLAVSPPLALFPGGTDASPFHGVGGIPTIAGFGPGQLPLAHGANEWVSVTSIAQAMRMYALTAIEFGAGID